MVNYLLDGWDRDHGTADGPMTSVVNNLYTHLSESDAYAMAEYVLSFQPQRDGQADRESIRAEAEERNLSGALLTEEETARTADEPVLSLGQEVFARACANCHRAGTDTVPLALTTAVNVPHAGNMLGVTRCGIRPPLGASSRSMPPNLALTREELAALASFVRWQFTDKPAWDNIEDDLDEVLAGAYNAPTGLGEATPTAASP
ncbi:hypothetical protein GI374_09450 [Paracoccus sp. S-4012]|uniref:c-type cytochrome n=1 Tax=Paracoccus sp. S-4012 TaxID=2665648 RepID=UPI0012B0ED1B|nr:cytochrome c [Paracoccus sp. S-4012]MRX50665.1 hypothetical protein [Paracoccus sp. S-4012]